MWNRLLRYIGYLLFGLILVIPYQMQYLKLALAFFILFPYVIKSIKKEAFFIDKNILLWVYLYVFMGLFYIVYAFLRGNPAPMLYFPVYVIWPVLFFLLIIQTDYKIYMGLISCMRYAFTIISVLGIIAFVIFNITLNSVHDFLMFNSTIRPGFPFVAIRSGVVTNMIFLYVFFWSLYIIDKNKVRILDKLNLILGFVFIFATSRRVVFLILGISIVASILFGYFFYSGNRKIFFSSVRRFCMTLLIWMVIIATTVLQLDLFDFESLWEFIGNAVGSESAGVGWDPRLLQYDSLLEGWLNCPILGNGTGVNASVVRSEIPGMYELSYMAMLFERGLLGTLIYAVQFLLLNYWMVKSLQKKKISSSYCIATLVAFDMFMFANATNPYLYAFDHIWVIFMVLVIINISSSFNEKDLCIDQSV